MLKRICAAALVLVLCLSGCTKPESTQTDGTQPETVSQNQSVTFTDDLGRTVTVDHPKRVAALLGSFADVWYLAGGEVIAAPDDAWKDLELPMPEEAKNLGNLKDLSLETLFASNPDFIIASGKTRVDLDWLETLEASGIPVGYFNVSDFDDYLRLLKVCTDITGRADLYEQNGLFVQKQVEEVIATSKERVAEKGAPTVLSLRASAASVRAKNSKNNVLGQMLKTLGCNNIADSDSSILENLSMEHIMASDPEYIFIVQSGDNTEGTQKKINQFIAENPAWNQLTAVKEGRVFLMEKKLFNLKPNSRWGEAYQELEQIFQKNEG